MAYGLKYQFQFNDNATNIAGSPVLVRVYIYQDGFSGTAQDLIPAESPCIINENNSNDDIFSPIRAKEMKIRFVTDGSTYPAIEDLLSNNDNEFKIKILVGSIIYLNGFLLNDQMQENWLTDGTNHIIEFTATDNLGVLKTIALADFDPSDKPTLYEIVRATLDNAIPDLTINIYDNLFEDSFDNRSDLISIDYIESFSATASTNEIVYLIANTLVYPGDTLIITNSLSNNGTFTVVSVDRNIAFAHIIVAQTLVDEINTQDVTITFERPGLTNDAYQQIRLDMRTFVTNYSEFDNCYEVLTKILESRNSVLFQHNGEWHIIRVCELFIGDVIPGTTYEVNGLINAIDWLAIGSITETGDFIPIENFMLKSYSNALKYNKVTFNYDNFDEFLCNQLWKRGIITIDTPTVKTYEVDCWNHYRGAIVSTTAASVIFGRRVEIDAATEVTSQEYIFLEQEPLSSGESFVRSAGTLVNSNDKVNFNFQRRTKIGYTGAGNELLGRALLYANDGTFYTLDDDGVWYLSNSTFTLNSKIFTYAYASLQDRNEWVTKEVKSDFIPKSGVLYLHLHEASMSGGLTQETWFKDLSIKYVVYIEGKNFTSVTGDYHKLTLNSTYKDSEDYITFISDSPKFLLKGAMFRKDGLTLTTLWYEYNITAIMYPLKRWNAISHYRVTNRNFQNVEGNFYKWLKSGLAITPLQKLTFINGAPNKVFIPTAINNIDVSKSLFDGHFSEVFDSTKNGVNQFTTTGSFYTGLTKIFVLAQSDMLIPGNVIVVSGATLNNGIFTIVSVSAEDVAGVPSTYIITAETTTDEFAVSGVTFTIHNANGDNIYAIHEFKYIYKNVK